MLIPCDSALDSFTVIHVDILLNPIKGVEPWAAVPSVLLFRRRRLEVSVGKAQSWCTTECILVGEIFTTTYTPMLFYKKKKCTTNLFRFFITIELIY